MENTKFFLDKFATLEDSEKEEFLSGIPVLGWLKFALRIDFYGRKMNKIASIKTNILFKEKALELSFKCENFNSWKYLIHSRTN